ncbi:MAG: AAA family ATPase, partial [Armatimonadota bacterium]
LVALGKTPRIIDWPDAPEHGDAADFQGEKEDWRLLIDSAKEWEPPAQRQNDAAPRATFQSVTKVSETVSDITWLWQDWIPNGYLTVLAGDPGVGKSMFALRLAQSVANPMDWPNGDPGPDEPAPVVYIDTEGSQAMHVQRCETWGVNTDRVLMPGEDGLAHFWLDEPDNLAAIRAVTASDGVGLVVIDSLRAGFRGDENSSEIAEMVSAWARLARDLNLPMVIVHHMRKRQRGERHEATLDSLRGSSAIGAAVRSVIAIEKVNPRTEALRVSIIKSNLAPKPNPFGVELSEEGITLTEAPRAPRSDQVLARAEEALWVWLAEGALSPSVLEARGEDIGISRATLYRARDSLGLVVMRDPEDQRRTLWGLPAAPGLDDDEDPWVPELVE